MMITLMTGVDMGCAKSSFGRGIEIDRGQPSLEMVWRC